MHHQTLNLRARQRNCQHSYSRHAAVRMQQRGVPPGIAELIMDYGDFSYRRDGGRSYWLTRKANRKASGQLGHDLTRTLEKYIGIYLITNEQKHIITVARSH